MLAGGQRDIDALLDRVGVRLLEPLRLGGQRGDELEPGQGRAAPHLQRPVEVAGCHQAGELERVDLLVPGDQPVAARRALQSVTPQRGPQPRHVDLHRLPRAGRRVVAPQLVDQSADRHHMVRLDREHAEQRLRLSTAERRRLPIVAVDLQRSK
jgi:hypothetical protein